MNQEILQFHVTDGGVSHYRTQRLFLMLAECDVKAEQPNDEEKTSCRLSGLLDSKINCLIRICL